MLTVILLGIRNKGVSKHFVSNFMLLFIMGGGEGGKMSVMFLSCLLQCLYYVSSGVSSPDSQYAIAKVTHFFVFSLECETEEH